MPAWYKTAAEVAADRSAREAERVERERARAYREEADPVFFRWQRGEATKDDWLSKVNEIKTRVSQGKGAVNARKP